MLGDGPAALAEMGQDLSGRTFTVQGFMVYSTCTLAAEENEENVRWALDNLPLDLLDARETVLAAGSLDAAGSRLAGLPHCGLSEEERHKVLRFDPCIWDVGFFAARFRRREGEVQELKADRSSLEGVL
mmetsp:Transcript_158375/g.507998  ORF Transcript_158375/g.507998 Transcript_158375/m.507998 type:complete len:129 (-) Transcript_158375:88-474(-)